MTLIAPHRWPAVVLVLAWALAPAVAPAAPASSEGSRARGEQPVDKIRKALDKVMDVEIDNQGLEVAIAQLREQSKVNFVIDRVTLGNMGLDLGSVAVSVKLHNVKLRSALRTVLGQHNLGYAILGDTVLITSEDMVTYRQLKQRVSLDFDKVPFAEALKKLSRETATNLLLDTKVQKEGQKPVSLQLDDVPLDTAVRLLAEFAGLKPVRIGNVLLVTTKEAAAELRAEPELVPSGPGQGVEMPAQPVPGVRVVPGGIGGLVPPPAVPPATPGTEAPPAEKPAKEVKKKD